MIILFGVLVWIATHSVAWTIGLVLFALLFLGE